MWAVRSGEHRRDIRCGGALDYSTLLHIRQRITQRKFATLEYPGWRVHGHTEPVSAKTFSALRNIHS